MPDGKEVLATMMPQTFVTISYSPPGTVLTARLARICQQRAQCKIPVVRSLNLSSASK